MDNISTTKTPKPNRRGPARTRYAPPTRKQAARIIARFGGEAALAKALDKNRATIYRWGYPKPAGTDGLVPSSAIPAINEAAARLGIVLTPADWSIL